MVHGARVESELEDATGCSAPLGFPTPGERKRFRGIVMSPLPDPTGHLLGVGGSSPPPGPWAARGTGTAWGPPVGPEPSRLRMSFTEKGVGSIF